ncbi:alpha-1,2-fucosyltransferase, partial [Brachyspira pilosicoli]|nr:alpha-1,2-fucosyltransferase [Brachyspira pilosicoli]
MSNNNSIVVMQVCDGFTDQILKLSFSIFIRDTFNRNVKLDLTFYDNNKKDFLGIDDREFILTKLFNNIKFEVATQEEIKKSKENFIDHTIGKDKILSELKKTNKSIYLDHKIVWIRYFYNLDFTKYFLLDDYLYKLLNDRQINILNDINNNESIAI